MPANVVVVSLVIMAFGIGRMSGMNDDGVSFAKIADAIDQGL